MTSARSTRAPANLEGLGATLELVMSACLPARCRTACEELHELPSESIPEFSRLSDKACLTLHTGHRREATFCPLRPVERPPSAATRPPAYARRRMPGQRLVAWCRATTPPVRLVQPTCCQPAASMTRASSPCGGHARIDSAR